jgi:hypothetical protein
MKGREQEHSPEERRRLTVLGASFYDDGGNLVVTAKLANPASCPLYAISSLRNLQYDAASRTLQLLLSERLNFDRPGTYIHPDFVEVKPAGETAVQLRLPRFVSRLVTQAAKMPTPKIERLPIHEAAAVHVEVDWGEAPFTPDPRAKTSVRQQIVDWVKATAVAQATRTAAPKPSIR